MAKKKAEKPEEAGIDAISAAEDELLAQGAYDRAIAWARSVKGTPYGAKEPTTK